MFNTEVKSIPESAAIVQDLENLKEKTLGYFDSRVRDLLLPVVRGSSDRLDSGLERQLLATSLDEYVQARLDQARLLGVLSRGGRRLWSLSIHALFPPPPAPAWAPLSLGGTAGGEALVRQSPGTRAAGSNELLTPAKAIALPSASKSLKVFAQEMSSLSSFVKPPGVPLFFSRETYEVLDKVAAAAAAGLGGGAVARGREGASALEPEKCVRMSCCIACHMSWNSMLPAHIHVLGMSLSALSYHLIL